MGWVKSFVPGHPCLREEEDERLVRELLAAGFAELQGGHPNYTGISRAKL